MQWPGKGGGLALGTRELLQTGWEKRSTDQGWRAPLGPDQRADLENAPTCIR